MFIDILLIAHLSIKELNRWIYFDGFIISMKMLVMENWLERRSLLYRNQSIDLLCKLMDWFLYDRDLCHEITHYTLMANFHHSWKRDCCGTWFPPLIADFGWAVVSLFMINLLLFCQNQLMFCHQQSCEKGSYSQQILLTKKKYFIKGLNRITITAWKVSKYGVFSGPYFLAFGPENTPYLDTFHTVH